MYHQNIIVKGNWHKFQFEIAQNLAFWSEIWLRPARIIMALLLYSIDIDIDILPSFLNDSKQRRSICREMCVCYLESVYPTLINERK